MLVKYIKLKNFRQYRGEQHIEFSTNESQNVTVLLGKNTAGKTTLLQAFKWCFYGIAQFKTKDLLNSDLEYEMSIDDQEIVSVKIEVIHAGITYTIYRQEMYTKKMNRLEKGKDSLRVSYIDKSGEVKYFNQHEAPLKVNEILPQELSDYFFFDTERIGTISNKKDVSNAVQGLLGLNVLVNARKHLGSGEKISVIGRLRGSLQSSNNEGGFQENESKIENLELESNQIKFELKNIKCEIENYERIKEEATIRLGALSSVKDAQEEKRSCEHELKEVENSYSSREIEFKKLHSETALNTYLAPLIKDAEILLINANVDDKGVIDITSRTIDELLARGTCLCGTCLTEGSLAEEMLLKERSFVPPQSLGSAINNFKKDLKHYENNSRIHFNSFKLNYKNMVDLNVSRDKLINRISLLSERIKGKDDARIHEETIDNCKLKLKQLNENILELNTRLSEIEKNIKVEKETIHEIARLDALNSKTYMYIDYAESILDKINTVYSTQESIIRQKLEQEVNEIFTLMYHGERIININDKYNVILQNTKDKSQTDPSTGLETVKNFAFITGLVSLAKNKIAIKDSDIELRSEPYPLVMDAPFSNADEEHVRNIARLVPDVAEQVLIFVMEKDWKHAQIEMGHKVGKTYYLDKQSETYTEIKKEGQ